MLSTDFHKILNKIYPILSGGFLVVAPFIYGTLSIYTERKEIVYITNLYFGLIFVLSFALRMLKGKQDSFTINKTDLAGGFFILYLLLSFFFYRSHLQETCYFLLTAICYIYFLCRSMTSKHLFISCIACGGTLQSVLAVLQYTGFTTSNHPDFPVTGSFANPAPLAGFILAGLMGSLGLFVKSRKEKKRGITYGFLTIFQTTGLLLADSRAAIIGFAGGISVYIYYYGKKMSHKQKIFSTGLLTVILFLGGVLLFNYRPESAKSRLLIWRVSWEMIRDKPVWGHGAGAFSEEYMTYQGNYFYKHPDSAYALLADNNSYAFNELIHLLVEFGIIVFFLFLAGIIRIFLSCTPSAVDKTLKAALVASLLFSLFSYPTSVFPLLLLFPTFIALLPGENVKKFSLPNIVFISAIVISLFISYKSTQLLQNSLTERDKIKKMIHRENCDEVNEYINSHFEKLISNRFFNSNYPLWLIENETYDTTRLRMINPNCETFYDIGEIYKITGDYATAESYYLKSSYMIPSRFIPDFKRWELYCLQGDTIKAIHIARQLLKKRLKQESTRTLRQKGGLHRFLEKTDSSFHIPQ